MKLLVVLAQDEEHTFFSGPTFFLGLITICFLLMVSVAVKEWWAKRKKDGQDNDGYAEEESKLPTDDREVVGAGSVESKAEKKQAAREARQKKKQAKEAKKKEKAATKAEAKAAKKAKKKKK
jgi:hypothetical protein